MTPRVLAMLQVVFPDVDVESWSELNKVLDVVAAEEREACAKVADAVKQVIGNAGDPTTREHLISMSAGVAAAIRMRRERSAVEVRP